LLMLYTSIVVGSPIFGFTSSSPQGRADYYWSRSCWLQSPRGFWESRRGWSRRFSGGEWLHFVTFPSWIWSPRFR
jgi:hypothetical protein